MDNEFVLDYDVVDNITKNNLKQIRLDLKEYVQKAIDGDQYMHPDDLHINQTKLIPAIETILTIWYGENL